MPASSQMPTAPPEEDETLVEPPFLRFYYSENFRAKTLAVLSTLEEARDSTRYRGALSDLIVELTESGMDYYFLRPLKLAKVGFVVEQSANVGMSGVMRLLSTVIHNIISRMDKTQLLIVCSYIRQLME